VYTLYTPAENALAFLNFIRLFESHILGLAMITNNKIHSTQDRFGKKKKKIAL
jgi:hypothetical protein